MRDKLFEMLEIGKEEGSLWNTVYNRIILGGIVLSLLPLMMKNSYPFFDVMESVLVFVFIVDYLLRWYTSPLTLKKGWKSYLYYPFTIFALIDLLAILPFFTVLDNAFGVVRIVRLIKVVRILKFLRYSKNFNVIANAIESEKKHLSSVVVLAVGYIFLSALVMFSVEPTSFGSFFDALYWSTTALTTVGYGDIHPVTFIGRLVSMVSSLFGIAIVAIPSGIVTAGYLKAIERQDALEKEQVSEEKSE